MSKNGKGQMRTLTYLSVLLLSLCANVADAQFALGKHYARLPTPPAATGNEKIVVREFFWYGCPHCYALEPYLERWLTSVPADVEYVRTPGVARRWLPHAQAYYSFEALGITEKVHKDFFDAIHKDGKQLNDEVSIAEFVSKYGVDGDSFHKAFNSFGVRTQVEKAKRLNFRYGIDSVPSITIDGRYKTSVPNAGGPDRLMQLMNYLINKARQDRGSSTGS
ncbi:MAG: thiol:disulfide interchange protein DsbA/DsbL [Acidiferrobacterales bacterium]